MIAAPDLLLKYKTIESKAVGKMKVIYFMFGSDNRVRDKNFPTTLLLFIGKMNAATINFTGRHDGFKTIKKDQLIKRPINHRLSLVISIFVILTTWMSYLRLTGRENIRPIHILTLITIGIGIGLFLVSLLMMIRNSRKD